MAELAKPVEVVELQDGQSVSFRVTGYDKGELVIHPRDWPDGKRITAIRVHVPPEDKLLFPHYWDLTAGTLVAQLEPHLRRDDLGQLRFTITARGIGLKKRFQVDVVRT
jgi:hypothetical protein